MPQYSHNALDEQAEREGDAIARHRRSRVSLVGVQSHPGYWGCVTSKRDNANERNAEDGKV